LVATYESATVANRVALREQLHGCTLKKDEKIDDYVARLTQIRLVLIDINEPPTESDMIYTLLKGVKTKYKSLVDSIKVSIDVNKQQTFTFDQVVSQLRDHEEAEALEENRDKDQENLAEVVHQLREEKRIGEEQQEQQKQQQQLQQQLQQQQAGWRGRGRGWRGRYRGGSRNQPYGYGAPRGGRGGMNARGRGNYGGQSWNPPNTLNFQWNPYQDGRVCYHCNKPGHIKANCPEIQNEIPFDPSQSLPHRTYLLQETVMSTNSNEDSMDRTWIVDSAATSHITGDKRQLVHDTIKKLEKQIALLAANKGKLKAEECGNVKLNKGIMMERVLYAPGAAANLMSVPRMTDKKGGLNVTFTDNGAYAIDRKTKRLVLFAPRKGDLYIVPKEIDEYSDLEEKVMLNAHEKEEREIDDQELMHQRLGHIGVDSLKKLQDHKAVIGLDHFKVDVTRNRRKHLCRGCILGKSHRHPFGNQRNHYHIATYVLDRGHADVCGPFRVISLGGNRYLSLIVDEKSRKAEGRPVKTKAEAGDHIIEWCERAENYHRMRLKAFNTDNGGEYQNERVRNYMKSKGIRMETTFPHTPQHNGIAERSFRTIMESTRAMMMHARIPAPLWSYVALAAIHIRNRCTAVTDRGKTPEEIWTGKKADISHLRIIGCDAYVHVPKQQWSKLEPKAMEGIFVGYDEHRQGGYLIWVPALKKVISSRDVIFDERKFTIGREDGKEWVDPLEEESTIQNVQSHDRIRSESVTSGGKENKKTTPVEEDFIERKEIAEESNRNQESDPLRAEQWDIDGEILSEPEHKGENENGSSDPAGTDVDIDMSGLRRSGRHRNLVVRDGMIPYSEIPELIMSSIAKVNDEPKGYRDYECIEDEGEKRKWKRAMDEEFHSLIKNRTWTLCPLPRNRDAVGSKWVYKKKINKDGEVDRYKARLVAKGYTQLEGIDFTETFAPTLRFKSLRLLLALAAARNWELAHMDVQTAFLNADMKEEVYMEQPEGYEIKGRRGERLYCKLLKTLYGTRQASNAWNEEISQFFKLIHFKRCLSDTCIYVRVLPSGRLLIVALFVDDLLIAYDRKDEEEFLKFKIIFMRKYSVRDLGNAQWMLGMRISRDRVNLSINIDQQTYIHKMGKQFQMEQVNPIPTPQEIMKLSKMDQPQSETERKEMQSKPYQSLVGALLYSSISTRPDVAHAVNMCSRFMSDPGNKHWKAAKRILRYLKATSDLGLNYGKYMQTSTTDHTNFNYYLQVTEGNKRIRLSHGEENQFELKGRIEGTGIELSGYCDSDWGGCLDTRRSTTGYMICINGGVISWSSKRQPTVALSSAEAEYMAMSAAAQELVWVSQLLSELGWRQDEQINLYTDSQSAKAIAEKDISHDRTKHIDIRHHYVRSIVKEGKIKLVWLSTKSQIADLQTKPLSVDAFTTLRGRFMNRSQSGKEI
jgi:hypothetical protein